METGSALRAGLRVRLVVVVLACGALSCAGSATGGGDGGYACTTATVCPGGDNECVARTCVNHTCGTENAAAGTVTATQTVGDCMRNECDGEGGVVTVVDDTDVPDDGNDCTTDSCSGGTPVHTPVPAGTPCQNGLVCNATGGCFACHSAADCPESTNECLIPTCGDGACGTAPVPDGTGCDDQSRCTLVDTCQSGQCVGGAPIVCTALDQCHDVGTCDPDTGVCPDPAKPDGSPCDDGDPCTEADTCQAGVCQSGAPVVCTALDLCHLAGTCDHTTGLCSNPIKTDGTGCSDGNACTIGDTCHAGVCQAGTPVVCSALDQCHDVGVCDPGSGVCSNPPKANGTACEDGDLCTLADTCQSGACQSGAAVVCTALDQCHDVGSCNPSTGACSNPPKANGTGCDDGSACTQLDSCQAGVCTGSSPVVCTALDECHDVGSCNPANGVCSNPEKAYGATCSGGYCDTGTCVPASHGTATFDYTGGVQQFTVPLGIVSVSFDVYGAQGNTNAVSGATGGLGGRATGTRSVTPGTILYVYVGGGGAVSAGGGYNGGGAAGGSGCGTAIAGGGGGASDVRSGGTALANRVIVAGGGGGAGGNRVNNCGRGTGGGGGGGYYGGGGGAGYPYTSSVMAGGGTQSAGGVGGTSDFSAANNGAPGSLGSGGAGGPEVSSAQGGSNTAAGGGAGGGATGGNGAYSGNWTGGSGAGGSGYLGGVTGGALTSGVRSGNGRVVITY